jgi:ABC-type sugar transport system permease subunit
MKRLRIMGRSNLAGYMFILPLLAVFSVFMLYSFYFVLRTSFFKVNITFLKPSFVGLANYAIALGDQKFFLALLNSFLLSAVSIFFGLTLGFLVAVLLRFKLRGRGIFHSLFFVPSMLPMAFIAVIFGTLLEYNDGLLNNMARFLDLKFLDQRWLSNPRLALASVSAVSIYLIGIPIMYYTAELATLNNSVFEAAIVDGASFRQILFLVLYPILKNTHMTIALSLLLGGFREMERVYLMTDGGPGGATEIISTYIFRNSRSAGANLGFVAAISVLTLLLAFVITIAQQRVNRRMRR